MQTECTRYRVHDWSPHVNYHEHHLSLIVKFRALRITPTWTFLYCSCPAALPAIRLTLTMPPPPPTPAPLVPPARGLPFPIPPLQRPPARRQSASSLLPRSLSLSGLPHLPLRSWSPVARRLFTSLSDDVLFTSPHPVRVIPPPDCRYGLARAPPAHQVFPALHSSDAPPPPAPRPSDALPPPRAPTAPGRTPARLLRRTDRRRQGIMATSRRRAAMREGIHKGPGMRTGAGWRESRERVEGD